MRGFVKGRIGIADGAIVADVGGNDGVLWQHFLNGAPCHARAHPVRLAVAGTFVPVGARIIVLMVHGRQLLQPGMTWSGGSGPHALRGRHCLPLLSDLIQQLLCDSLGVTLNGNGDFLGQANTVRVDVNLNDLGVLWPVVDAVARQG